MASNENEEKLTKSSFVNPKDYEPQKEKPVPQTVANVIKIGDREVPVLKPDIALTLIYGKLNEVVAELKMLNATFSKAASSSTTFQNNAQTPTVTPTNIGAPTPASTPTAPASTPSTAPASQQSPRVTEILTGLEAVKDLLIIDVDSSAMFVIVRPSKFLGSENFSKVASAIRELGGQYVSAGKNSHFTIPKAPKKQ
jgi:hypothetical protein